MLPLFDSGYLLLIIVTLVISGAAQLFVTSAYKKWSGVRNAVNLNGAQVGQAIVDRTPLGDFVNAPKSIQAAGQFGANGSTIRFLRSSGQLTDHYDPRSKILRLSQDVYFAPTVAAAGIAAHEAGHAIQDADDYFPMEARTYIVPVVQLASKIAPWLFIAGLMLQLQSLIWIGVILFGSSSLFAFLTLPVELNASSRAEQLLVNQGIIRGDQQIAGVQNVLGAAAWTYVAAAVSALGGWLFYVALLLSQTRQSADRS